MLTDKRVKEVFQSAPYTPQQGGGYVKHSPPLQIWGFLNYVTMYSHKCLFYKGLEKGNGNV